MTENIQVLGSAWGFLTRRFIVSDASAATARKWVTRSALIAMLVVNYLFFLKFILPELDRENYGDMIPWLGVMFLLFALMLPLIYVLPYWFFVRRGCWQCVKGCFQFMFVYMPYSLLLFCVPGLLTPESQSCFGPDPYQSCGPVAGFFNAQKRAFKGLSEDEAQDLLARALKQSGDFDWLEQSKVPVSFTETGGSYYSNKSREICLQITQTYEEVSKACLHETGHAYFQAHFCPEARTKGMKADCRSTVNNKRNMEFTVRSEIFAECWETGDTAQCKSEDYMKSLFSPLTRDKTSAGAKWAWQAIMHRNFYESYDVHGWAWVNQNRPNAKYFFRQLTKWQLPIWDYLKSDDLVGVWVVD